MFILPLIGRFDCIRDAENRIFHQKVQVLRMVVVVVVVVVVVMAFL